ncbi:MAG: hypothetical protein KBA31_12940 [Alphaproteobacteria bacterium]|nr:hypothetical protein [Alphaproteobacteria bacterium]
MKIRKSLAALGIVVGLIGAASTASAEPPSYPLLCRGGGNMKIMVNHDVDGAGIPGATAMTIFFTPAGVAGGVSAPPPGQCVWMDRTFRPGEPANMWIRSPNIEFAFQVTGDGRVVYDGSGPRVNVEGAHISPEARAWDSVVRAVLSGGLFTVQVYNESGRTMVITRVGP